VLRGPFRDYLRDGLKDEADPREWEYSGVQQGLENWNWESRSWKGIFVEELES
jgi:hypothetical protein